MALRNKRKNKVETSEYLGNLKKDGKWYTEYYSNITGKKEILDDTFLRKLERYIVNSALSCDGVKNAYTYITDYGIPPKAYQEWLKKFDYIREAHELLVFCIGNKREEGALTRRLDSSFVAKGLPMYLSQYAELEEWRAKLKEDSSGNASVKIEVVQIAPTDIVPRLANQDLQD
jgi:hypothetical protein